MGSIAALPQPIHVVIRGGQFTIVGGPALICGYGLLISAAWQWVNSSIGLVWPGSLRLAKETREIPS